jgi:(2Fe-2S) ferredoxin
MDQHIMAIRLACEEERRRKYSTKKLEIYKIPPTHRIFNEGELSPVSALLGFPVLVLKLRPSIRLPRAKRPELIAREKLAYGSAIDGDYFENPEVTKVMTSCDPTNGQDPTAPLAGWAERVGCVLMVRVDGKPLAEVDFEAMQSFVDAARERGLPTNEEELYTLLSSAYLSMYYEHAKQFFTEVVPSQEMTTASPLSEAEKPAFDEIKMVREDGSLI